MMREKKLDVSYLWMRLYHQLFVMWLWVAILAVLSGIQVWQNVRTNRLLRSVDQSLKMLPGVARGDRRAA